MSLRNCLAIGAALLLTSTGCGDEDHHHGEEDGHHHESHGDGGAGTCDHLGLTAECDAELDAVGARVSDADGVTIEVTGATPMDPIAGEGDGNMLMLKITDAAGDPVTGATLAAVITEAHGGHGACGSAELTEMDGGMYHLEGLLYPHGGTWHHEIEVGGSTLDLEICVLNAE